MRNAVLLAAVMAFLITPAVFPSDLPEPITTLTTETGNNTSASPVFFAQENGNNGAGNVSKVPPPAMAFITPAAMAERQRRI